MGALPPGSATALLNRARAGLGRLRNAMAPPPVQILESLFGLLDHGVLVALCRLGVPDVLDRPLHPSAIAARVETDPARLERLLRFAATRGWVRMDRAGRVRPTRVTRFLRTDHPGGWRAWVEFAGSGEVVAAVGALGESPGKTDPFTARHGAPFFTWMADHPERWAVFDAAMAAGARMHGLALAQALDWSPSRRVCDVGGGTGELLTTLLDCVPHLEATAFDLPPVIERAAHHPRLTVVGGDAFVAVPSGFDTYLVVNVLHDWSDVDALEILDALRRVSVEGTRIIVVESDRTPVPHDDLAIPADVLMAALTAGGRERSPKELAELGRRSGFRQMTTTRLASGDLAHELRV